MTLFISYQNGESTFLEATILTDTVGTIDIRPKIQLQYVTDVTKFLGTEPTKADKSLLPGSIIFMNSYQSLALIRASSGEYCFDVPTKQLIPLPDTLDSKKIIATEKDGVYIIMTNDTIHLFDRFGRTPLKTITYYDIGEVRLSWAGKYSELTYQKESIKLAGSWWPIKHDEKTYFTNGVKIFFIK
jgi:hypothetical protein